MRPLELSADLKPPRLPGPEIALAPAPLSPSPPLQLGSLSPNLSRPLKAGVGMKASTLVSVGLHVAFIFSTLAGLSATMLPETDDLASAIEVDLVTLPAEAVPDPALTASTASVALVSAGQNQPQPVQLEEIAPDSPVVSETLPDLPPPPIEIAQVVPDAPVVTDDLPPLLAATAVATEPVPLPPPSTKPEPPEPELPKPEATDPETPKPEPVKPVPQKVAEKAPVKKPVEKPKAEKPVEKPKPQKTKAKASTGNGGKSDTDLAASAGGKPQKAAKASGSGSAEVAKYPGLVQRKLRRALRFPKGAGSARGDVAVTFTVAATGSVSGIKVVASSGHPVLDQEAIATVKRAAPFPAIPADAGRSSWTFTMPLTFAR